MRIKTFLIGLLYLMTLSSIAQKSGNISIKIRTQKKGISIRGLSIPNENIIWASGSKGNIAFSNDGGKHFNWKQIDGYENRDFRSIYAWNDKEVIVAAISAPAVVLKTTDGGATWYKVYENKDTSMFLDAIYFKNELEGTLVGDPLNQFLFVLKTKDKGAHWEQVDSGYFKTSVRQGEAFFASSNSSIAHFNNDDFLITGGLSSRLWVNGQAIEMPIVQGTKSTGANSIAIAPNGSRILIVGGDFTKKEQSENNIVGFDHYLYDQRKETSFHKLKDKKQDNWVINHKIGNPHGYKSSVCFISNKIIITGGTSGVDISFNKGKTWHYLSNESFHVVQKQPGKLAAFLAGVDGRIGYISFE